MTADEAVPVRDEDAFDIGAVTRWLRAHAAERWRDRMRGEDAALGAVIGRLVETAPLGPDEVAAEVLAGIDRGEELILPDPAARAAYRLKCGDRAAYDLQMRHQAARLQELA